MTTTPRDEAPVAEAHRRACCATGCRLRFTAYDGSAAGPPDAPYPPATCATERGLSYLLTAPGDLGMARAYVSGDLDVEGVHPGDPYDALVLLHEPPAVHGCRARPRRWRSCAALGLGNLRPPPPPPEEAPAALAARARGRAALDERATPR